MISLLLLPFRPAAAKKGVSVLTSIKEGLRFIQNQNGMSPLIAMAFLMTMLGIPLMVFLPVVVRDVFHLGPTVFTVMLCVSGAGAVVGALTVAAYGHIHNKGQVALLTLTSLGALMAAFGLSRNLILSYVLLFVASAALVAVFAMVSSLVQLIVPDEMRGRVMSVYNLAFRGGMPFGSLISGHLMSSMTVGSVLVMNGVALALLGLYFLVVHRRVADL
jgi:predicted MFS family arabinose efflux permease